MADAAVGVVPTAFPAAPPPPSSDPSVQPPPGKQPSPVKDSKEAASRTPQPLPQPQQQQQQQQQQPCAAESQRLWFSVELKPGETTIVSWKRLLKESGRAGGSPAAPAVADAPLSMQAGPSDVPAEKEPKDEVPPPNRFSAVIEKIERLYVGKQSSDEEEDDIPDEDQYDTEDSFIDDTELDEYFEVDKLTTKHDGYFVNKGKLEHFHSEPSLSPKEEPKKRRRKDRNLVVDDASNMRVNDAAGAAPLVGRNLSSTSKALTPYGRHRHEKGQVLKNKSSASSGIYRKRKGDFTIKSELFPALGAENKDVPVLPDMDKHKAVVIPSSEISNKTKAATEAFDPIYQASCGKGQVEVLPKKLQNSESAELTAKVRYKERFAKQNFSGTSSSVNAHSVQQTFRMAIEGSSVRPKGTTLERAIRDLERIVAEYRPPSLRAQDVDPAFQGVKRRLPQEVKQKLAKVARLSAGQGKLSKNQLIDRLMGILGHLVQRRTLKENMKRMVELGLSAKQQKADRFQQIKKEINEMIGARVSQLKPKVAEQQDGSADDFQYDERRALRGKFVMDATLEDKICDLYDLYIEGMDEDKGPRSRKLYVELAEMWPNGCMDNVGIKDAVYRSKERKKSLIKRNKVRSEERIKRRRLAATRASETNMSAQKRAGQGRSFPNNAGVTINTPEKPVSIQLAASANRLIDPAPPSDFVSYGSKNPEKVRRSISAGREEGNKAHSDLKKRMKRKAESDLAEMRAHPPKFPAQHVIGKQRVQKHADDITMNQQPKLGVEIPGVSGSHQPNLMS